MEQTMGFMILLQIILIGLNAVFACAEIAVISMNDNKLNKMAENGDKRAQRLVKLTSQPARFLATIQVAITLSGFLGSAFAAENFSEPVVRWIQGFHVSVSLKTLENIVVVFITIILSYFTLVFGELVPKRVAMRKAESLALGMSGLIASISTLFAPLVSFLTFSTNLVLRIFGIDPEEEDSEVSEEEIRMMVDVGSEKGTIDDHEKELIQNVFEFDDITAGDIVTHRRDITLLFLEETMEEWKNIIYASRHALYPICDESPDHVVGILSAKEYLRLEDKSRECVMELAVKPAYFVPEHVRADVLFRNMKNSHNTLAVVLDEYGGLCGIVTMNDLVEQLVGELGDDENEDSKEEEYIEQVHDTCWCVSGRTSLECISEAIGVNIEDEEHETLNGLVFSILESVPQDGTSVEVETEDLIIRVTDILEHQINKAVVELKRKEVLE